MPEQSFATSDIGGCEDTSDIGGCEDTTEDFSDSENDHELTFTVHDVAVLRASLEADSTIMQSIASISADLTTIISEEESSLHSFEKDEEVDDIPEEVLLDDGNLLSLLCH